MSAPALQEVAAWQVPEARRAVTVLAGVADRLPPWRSRVDAVGATLTTPGPWSGPAASAAADAVRLLSAVAVALAAGLGAALEQLQRAQVSVEAAQPAARRALALAAGADVQLLPDGAPAGRPAVPTPATAADQARELTDRARAATLAVAAAGEALEAAARAAGAAAAAEEALPVRAALHPVTGFEDLAGRLGATAAVAVPVVPLGAPPGAVAGWWAGLSLPARLAVLGGRPDLVGGLDGLPAWARDRANRVLLGEALRAGPGPEAAGARAVAAALADAAHRGEPVQLLEFDNARGEAAVALGDLDTAADVGLLVPGMGTTVAGDVAGVLDEARRVRAAAAVAVPGAAVATVAWLGYRAPGGLLQAAFSSAARAGGALLDRTLAGLAATRAAAGRPRARTTVLAHSYGTEVALEAAARPGRLAADAVVVLGSPGMGWAGPGALEAPEVYAAGSPADPVSYLGRFGEDPTGEGWGATVLPTDLWETHTSYYDPAHPTLRALGRVVTGSEPQR